MPALQVKDFPADLYEDLRERAKLERRSISQEAVVAIREHLAHGQGAESDAARAERDRQARAEKMKRLFEEIHAMPKPVLGKDAPTPTEVIREIRDSR
jgi:transcription elongation GreA/GreB family factor